MDVDIETYMGVKTIDWIFVAVYTEHITVLLYLQLIFYPRNVRFFSNLIFGEIIAT